MKIIVVNRDGNQYRFNANPDKYVNDLKSKIQENEGTPIDQQILILNCKQLEGVYKLSDCNISDDAVILLVDVNNSLLLRTSTIFAGSSLIDRIHQSYIDLKTNPKEDDVVNLLTEALSYLDKNLEFNLAKELFTLILSCFSHYPNQSLAMFAIFLQNSSTSLYQMLICPLVFSFLAQYNSNAMKNDYDTFISQITGQILPQFDKSEDQPIVLFGFQVPHQFRISLLTDVILLTELTAENIKIFYPFIFSHSTIPKSKLNFFIAKVFNAKLITAIPESQLLENNRFLDFSIDNLSDFLSGLSKQSFVKILPLINDKFIQKSSSLSLPLNFSTTCIFKCINFDIKFDSIEKLFEQLQIITEDMPIWAYLNKHGLKLTEKCVSKIKSYPQKPYIVKVLPQSILTDDFFSRVLLEAEDFSIYKTVFSYNNFDCSVLSKMEFWKHIMSLVSKVDCDEDTIYQFAFQFKRKFGLIKIVDFYTHMIFDDYPPNEKQARFLVVFMDKLLPQYRKYFYENQNGEFTQKLINQKIIPPLSLCKLFYFKLVPSLMTSTFLLLYEFSYERNESKSLKSVSIKTLSDQSIAQVIDFISQKNNYNLLNRFDQNSISLIACSLFYTSNKTPIILKGLTQQNILPFFAISFNYLHECKNTNLSMNIKHEFFDMFIDSLQLLEKDKSKLSIVSVNSILSNIDYLFDERYFSTETAITMIDFLCNSVKNGEDFVDKKLFLLAIFKASAYKNLNVLAKTLFKEYNVILFKYITRYISIIINDADFENIKLDLDMLNIDDISDILCELIENTEFNGSLYQIMQFIIKYCSNVPDFEIIKTLHITNVLQEKIISEKWDDAMIVLDFMDKFEISTDTQSLLDRKLRSDVREQLFIRTNFKSANDIVTYILDDPQPEKHHYLFRILFNFLFKNLTASTKFIEIFLLNNVSNEQLTPTSIQENLGYLYQNNIYFFKHILMRLFLYNKKDSVFARKCKIRHELVIMPDFNFMVKLINSKSYQSFTCFHSIASSFPFYFEENPSNVINVSFPVFDCFQYVYDSDVTDETISLLKAACAALSFLFSCLYSTNFISEFSVYLFQNIINMSNSHVFALMSILYSLFKTPRVNVVVLSLAIKFDFLNTLKNLARRNIPCGPFKNSYFNNLYNLIIEFYTLLASMSYNDALFIEQVYKNEIINPFYIRFDNYPTVSQETFEPLNLYFPQDKSFYEPIKEFMDSLTEVQPFWITCKKPLFYGNKTINNSIDELLQPFQSNSVSKEVFDELPPLPRPMTIKMQRFLVTKPLWVFNWIDHGRHFPKLKEHYTLLENTITTLTEIQEQTRNSQDPDDQPFKNEYNVYNHFSNIFCNKELFDTLLNQKDDSSKNRQLLYKIIITIVQNSTYTDMFLPFINEMILKAEDISLSPKLFNGLVVYLYQLSQQNYSFKSAFYNSYLGRIIYISFSPIYRNNLELLVSMIHIILLFNQSSLNCFIHLIGFILLANNIKICKLDADLIVQMDERKSCMMPIIYKSFDNMLSSNYDLPFDDIKYYIDRIPSIKDGCLSTLSKYINKIIAQIIEHDYEDYDLSELICDIFNYFIPDRKQIKHIPLTKKPSLRLTTPFNLTQSSNANVSLYQASQELVETSELFWKEIYNENRYFIKNFIEKDTSVIYKLKFIEDYFELLPFRFRLNLFQKKMNVIKENVLETTLRISHENVLNDTISQLLALRPELWLSNYQIEFVDKENTDASESKKEWINLVIKEIFNPKYALFKQDNNFGFHPNDALKIDSNLLQVYKIAGVIFGISFLECQNLRYHFSMSFLRNILHQKTSFFDLEDYDERLFKILLNVRENSNPEALNLTFQIYDDTVENGRLFDLVENGVNVKVTKENAEVYSDLYADYKLRECIKDQINAFSSGFDTIIPPESMRMFTPSELDFMICGIPNIEVSDLKEHAHYQGVFNKDHPTIQMLFNVLESWDSDDLTKLFKFITGTSQVPLNGLRDLEERGRPIVISSVQDKMRFPAAHTYVNTLDLPVYDTEKEMSERLYMAIQQQ